LRRTLPGIESRLKMSPYPSRSGVWRLVVWLMPVWCWFMPFVIFGIAGGEIDAVWLLAMVIPVGAGIACGVAGRKKLMWYSFVVGVGVLAINIALPSLARWL